jgi:hypothetical protein
MSALEKSSLPRSLPRLLDSELSHVDRQIRPFLDEQWRLAGERLEERRRGD